MPIWLTLISTLLATLRSMPIRSRVVLVTNRSSPTSWTLAPSARVSSAHPSQSSSAIPSSRLTIGYCPTSRVPVRGELGGRQHLALARQVVVAVAVQLADGRIQGDGDLVAGLVAGLLDRLDEDLDGVLVGCQVRREPTLVADRGRQAAVVEQLLQRVVRLGAPPQRLARSSARRRA